MTRTARLYTFLCLGLALRGAAFAGEACESSLFVVHDLQTVPGRPVGVAVADFNADGKQDIAVAQTDAGGNVSVLLGDASGNFVPVHTATDMTVMSMALADFDGDGKIDVVLGTSGGNIFLSGNGDGTFQPLIAIPGQGFQAMAATDLNGDGFPDLVGFDLSSAILQAVLGNGDGTFGSPIVTFLDFSSASSIAVGDVDGDGLVDALVSSIDTAGVSLYPGLGDGSFGPRTFLPLDSSVSQARLADFNNDGRLDVAVANFFDVRVLLQNPNGTFQPPITSYAGPSPAFLMEGDLNVDGETDLAVLNLYDTMGFAVGSLWPLFGLGDGTFYGDRAWETGPNSTTLAIADLGTDGLPDIVVGNNFYVTVSILYGQGAEEFRGVPVSALGEPLDALVKGDFNEDGWPDVATGAWMELAIRLNNTQSAFVAGDRHAFTDRVTALASADFNRDGHADLVATTSSTPIMRFLPGHGDGTFGPISDFSIPVGDTFDALATGDLNEDGNLDVVLAAYNFFGGTGHIVVYLGNGDGSFQPALMTPLPLSPVDVFVSSFDPTGHLDIVVVGGVFSDPGTMIVLHGDGDGNFTVGESYATGGWPQSIAAGDFDEDGHKDLVVADELSSNVAIYLGHGDGQFDPALFVATGWNPIAAAVDDMNGDGHDDIVMASQSSQLVVLEGLGNATFLLPNGYPATTQPIAVAIDDFDGNGTPDVVVGSRFNGAGLALFENSKLAASALVSLSAIVGEPVSLSVVASGLGPLTYQWRKDGVPLFDGGAISGATTATLTIDPTAFTDAGAYDVVVTDSCTTVTSNAATLSIEFADVPLSNPFHDDIITIATAGIAVGCTDTTYCPSVDVSRAEMAVFLLKAKFGSDHVPPPPGGQIFDDVPPGSFAEEWIAELAGLGITVGCGNGNYCPDAPVTRGEMAVFLLKTLLGSGYVPPTATGIFSDVPSDYFAIDWIEDLYLRAITAGCGTGPLRYCPDEAVPREQMATFIVRTFLIP